MCSRMQILPLALTYRWTGLWLTQKPTGHFIILWKQILMSFDYVTTIGNQTIFGSLITIHGSEQKVVSTSTSLSTAHLSRRGQPSRSSSKLTVVSSIRSWSSLMFIWHRAPSPSWTIYTAKHDLHKSSSCSIQIHWCFCHWQHDYTQKTTQESRNSPWGYPYCIMQTCVVQLQSKPS